MRVRNLVAALVIAVAFAGSACAQGTAGSPQGVWVTASRNLEVEIGPCGENICGTVVRVLANNSMSAAGEPSATPLDIGALLITGLHADGDHWKGRIFNRENGRTYDCTVRRLPNGTLEVRPYVVLPVIGRTQIWQPAAAG